ncbi:putative fungal specific transcription factor [Lyophyllum shimeji]|uniref:Fungal specific transcription factor n=1 Tax=Lyophyllum shimeji TaxID=47721 RepID=A0A9P3PUH5_LYOSH|nr:putative fungal specific transcription factor [Lyophyllum shimeji]
MDPYRSSQHSASSSFLPTTFDNDDSPDPNPNPMKALKRKRLAKACDACHKSKRRCDGTDPCSNCYYASKSCTYTDSSGRPVPAPHPFKQDRLDGDQRGPQPSTSTNPPPLPQNRDHQEDDVRRPQSNHPPQNDVPRKRFRNERGHPIPTEDISSIPLPVMDPPITGSIERPAPFELDPSLTRELTNLFFTHCHPARVIIHKPTFSANLAHNRVPTHLLHAVCALAAPLSKQPRLRTTPSRFAGKPFAQEALSLMFDGAGRLVCERNLATAQALCLLQVHDLRTNDKNVIWDSRYHDLAMQLVEQLNVYQHEYPTLTPVPSPEFIQASIEREAVRRIFWLIHFMDIWAFIYYKRPTEPLREYGMRLRLPSDETSFELGVHSTLPEFGHLIRVVTIYAKVEKALDELSDPDPNSKAGAALLDAEHMMESWLGSLPDHLRFSEQSLQVQQSMFETSSNTGAWAWCFMHVIHASSALALNLARQRTQKGPKSEPAWALKTLDLIMEMLGDRVKNSILMGSALWALIKYCQRDGDRIRTLCADYEDAWGTRVDELVMSLYPSSQHQYPSTSQQSPSQPHHQPPHSQQPSHQHQQQPQQQNRRLADARNPPISGARPSSHQHDSSYHRKSPGSPGSSPTSHSLEELRMHSNHNTNSAASSHSRSIHSQSRLKSDRDSGRGHAGSGTDVISMSVGQGGNGTKREREHEGNAYPHKAQPRRSVVHDADMEPARDNADEARVGGGENCNANGGQGQPRAAGGNSSRDGSQSLPSLKSVGLLAVQHQVTMPVGLQWLANESR